MDASGFALTPDDSQGVEPPDSEGAKYCAECDKTFSATRSYRRHLRTVTAHAKRQYQCPICNDAFTRSHDLERHKKKKKVCQASPLAADGDLGTSQGSLDTIREQDEGSEESCTRVESEESSLHSLQPFHAAHAPGVSSQNPQAGDEFSMVQPLQGQLSDYSFDFGDLFPTTIWETDFKAMEDPPYGDMIDWPLPPEMNSQEIRNKSRANTPELSRGNTPSSDHSLPDVLVQDCDRPLIEVFSEEDLVSGSVQPRRRQHPYAKRDVNHRNAQKSIRCTLCKCDLGETHEERHGHMLGHIEDEQGMKYMCEDCNLHFAYKADLEYHRKVPTKEQRGFPCHAQQDNAGFCETADYTDSRPAHRLQKWELSELQLATSTVQRAGQADSRISNGNRFSVRSSPLARFSSASFAFSLRSFRSETVDVDHAALLDAVEKGVANLQIRDKKVRRRWHKTQFKKTRDSKSNAKTPTSLQIRRAALIGHVGEITDILSLGEDVNALGPGYSEDMYDFTPLMLATEFGHRDAVECLVNHGADVRVTDKAGRTAAHLACENRYAMLMPSLFTLDSILTTSGSTLTTTVTHEETFARQHATSLSKLIGLQGEAGFGTRPAVNSALWHMIGIVRPLFNHSKWTLSNHVLHHWIHDVSLRGIGLNTAINQALGAGRIDLLHILLATVAADADRLVDSGCGVFANVATVFLDQIFQFLSRNTTAILHSQSDTQNPYRMTVVWMLRNLDVFIMELIALGARVKTGRILRCLESPTPLYIAVVCELKETTEHLVAIREHIDTSVHGETALGAAARVGNVEVVRLLLAKGANPIPGVVDSRACIDQCAVARNTTCPLRWAVTKRRLRSVQAQLGQELDLEVPILDYFGALYLAIETRDVAIVEAILQSEQWTLSPGASTALLAISIAGWAKQAREGANLSSSARKDPICLETGDGEDLRLLDISDMLIKAGAWLGLKSREVLLKLFQDTEIPPEYNYI